MNDAVKTSSRKIFIIIIAVLVLLIAGTAVLIKSSKSGKKASDPSVSEKALPVETIVVKTRTAKNIVLVPGYIEAFEHVRLSSEIAGKISEIRAEKGAKIKAGDVLMKIDDRNALNAVKQAELQNSDALKDYERLEKLKETGAISDSDYDKIQKMKDMSDIALSQAKVLLSQCVVESPIDGVVNDRFYEAGEYVNSGKELFDIVNISKVKAVFNIPEREVMNLDLDSEWEFEIESIPGRVFSGKASFIASAAGKDNNSFKAELVATNPDMILKPGMIARISILKKNEKQMLEVPLSAIIPLKGDHVVYVVEKGKAGRRVVKMAEINGNEAIITSGLSDGDQVIVEGARALTDGVAVKILKTNNPVDSGVDKPTVAEENK